MTDDQVDLDTALEAVFSAARAHLAAVKAADGRVDDETVWQAYVALSNASYDYDGLLLDVYDEVTPWNVPSPTDTERQFGVEADSLVDDGDDPYPHVISVRQRRDYQVPSVTALMAAAEQARAAAPEDDDEPADLDAPITTVGEAILELLQAGDGSLAALDVPELEPMDGIVTIAEVVAPLDLDAYDDADGNGPYHLGEGDKLVGRLDEHPYGHLDSLDGFIEVDDEEDEEDGEEDEEDDEDEDGDDDALAEPAGTGTAGEPAGPYARDTHGA